MEKFIFCAVDFTQEKCMKYAYQLQRYSRSKATVESFSIRKSKRRKEGKLSKIYIDEVTRSECFKRWK